MSEESAVYDTYTYKQNGSNQHNSNDIVNMEEKEEKESDFNVRYYTDEGSNKHIDITMYDAYTRENNLSSAITFNAFGHLYKETTNVMLSKHPLAFLPAYYQKDAPRIFSVKMNDEESKVDQAYMVITNLMDYDDMVVQTFTNIKSEALFDFGICSGKYHILHTHPYYLVEEECIPRYDETRYIKCHYKDFPIHPNKNYIFRLIQKSYIKKTLEEIMKFKCLTLLDE